MDYQIEYRNAPKSKLEHNFSNLSGEKLDKKLAQLKKQGYRLYAFLLAGSWTSVNFYAKNHLQAYRAACKKYDKDNVMTSYLRGSVDCYVMDGWIGFNIYH